MPNALGIFHMDVTDDVCLSVGGDAAAIPKEFSKYTIDHVVEDLENFISDEKEKSDFISLFSRKALINAYQNGTAQFDQVVRANYDDNGAKYARLAARLILNPSNDHIECVIYGVDVTEEIMEKYSHDATIKDQLDIFNALGKDYLNIFLIDPNAKTATILNTNSRPTYRQTLGYNNPILRQTPLTGGSLPAVAFLDLDYSICRLWL